MASIIVKGTDGSVETLTFEANPNSNLMELLTEKGKDIAAICGGMANCGTCHVQLTKGFDITGNKSGDEEFMLDTLPNITAESRLSCQVPLIEDLDGAELEVLGDG